jgi:hypothetical protein
VLEPIRFIFIGISLVEKKMSTVSRTEKVVKQLRAEANIERIKVSMACKDLIDYCQDRLSDDVLVRGFKHTPNPFPTPKPCCLI